MAICSDERALFVALGARGATLYQNNHMTQVQLAQAIGVAQSTVNAYGLGQRRVPVSAFPLLAGTRGVDLETLMRQDEAKAGRCGLAQQMERISQLPKPKQRFVMEMLDTVLAQAGR